MANLFESHLRISGRGVEQTASVAVKHIEEQQSKEADIDIAVGLIGGATFGAAIGSWIGAIIGAIAGVTIYAITRR